jgi:hypothetical protein
MARFVINDGYSSSQEVEADYFATVGDFVDFEVHNVGTVFRIKASNVETITRQEKKQ